MFMPEDFTMPDGTKPGIILAEDEQWQIVMTSAGNSALIVLPELHEQWVHDNFIGENLFVPVSSVYVLACGRDYVISSLQQGPYPKTYIAARAFAITLRETRKTFQNMSFHDAIYLEQYSLLLPTYTQTEQLCDDYVLGKWLSSGVNISARDFGKLCKLTTWLNPNELKSIVSEAGFAPEQAATEVYFSLPGRPALESFFNEHVIEIVRNEERYKRVGIDFPSAIVLYGPPGCGKTFAVDQLVKFLNWPSYSINSGTIGSPYIHDTSRKIAGIFDEVVNTAPSVIIIDEMDAFLSDRGTNNAGTHHVEEVSEFLRRIPEASKQRVLVIAMTNRLDAIDPAILRRGRFDHVVEVNMPDALEVLDLLSSLVKDLPVCEDVDLHGLADKLAGHSLADAAFVVKEAGRLSVRKGKAHIDDECINAAYELLSPSQDSTRKIGF